MNCMKCGRITENNHVFCSRCLDVMARYPISPGTVVKLPPRRSASSVKKPVHRPERTEEEVIAILKTRLRRLRILTGVLALLLALGVTVLIHILGRQQEPPIGQNYSTVLSG